MKWPLVWRSTFEEWKDAALAMAHGDRQVIIRLHDALAEREATIRALEAKLAPAETPERQKSKLTQAIRDQARQPDGSIDRRLVGYFRARANTLLNEGKTVDTVIETLGEWQTTEREDRPTIEKMIAAFNDESL